MNSVFQLSGRKCGGILLTLLLLVAPGRCDDFAGLCADRRAIERVYYNHRLGEKPPFEQTLSPATIERLVRDDLRKEAALKKAYGLEVTPAMVETEVQRINTTTRAPETLVELKAALSNDVTRFARAVAKPIVVERLLRQHFDNDDNLHAAQRQQAEQARQDLLAARQIDHTYENLLLLLTRKHSNEVSETTWHLGSPVENPRTEKPDEAEIRKRFGQDAKIVSSSSGGEKERKLYFADLPSGLQRVLSIQLRKPGDVSAVVEMPGGFLLYLAKERTDQVLTATVVSFPKHSFERWLAEESASDH